MNERLNLNPDPQPEENGFESRELFLSPAKKKELGGIIPNYVAEDVALLLERKEWKNMPQRSSMIHAVFDNTSQVIEATVFKPELWLRSNKFLINFEDNIYSQHKKDRRRFRGAIIRVEKDFEHERFNNFLDLIIPRLGREKGDSEIEKKAKAAPVFLLAPVGMREELGELLKEREDLYATKAVEKKINGKRHTIGEGRIKKKSEFPHVNLWENSKKKKFDYLGVAISELLHNLQENDPRIKQVHLSSEYLGDYSIERRLRNSNNYLRDISSAQSGIGIEIEYSCGCRFAKYREKGNIYIDKLGKCPTDIEISKEELPDFDMSDFRKKIKFEKHGQMRFFTEDEDDYPKKGIKLDTVLISQGFAEFECPDGCGKNATVQTHAGKKDNGYAVIQAFYCPTSGDFHSKNVRSLSKENFLQEFGEK